MSPNSSLDNQNQHGAAFSGQAALVTGGASGIGLACARLLGARGAKVVIADRNEDKAHAVANELRASGFEAAYCGGNVARPDEANAIIAFVVRQFGKLDVLIHSAGVGVEKKFLDTDDQEWLRLIDIDLNGAFYILRAAGRAMVDKGYGRIVTLSSTAGVRGGTGRAAYGAAKGGLITLTKVLAVELAEKGVTANALAPGAIETELVARMHSLETRLSYRRSIPLNRYGMPNEVAEAALFLATPAASYITGVVLPVDGGFLAAGVINR